ncbi:uncharacterized protein FOMMEDRAFT_20700 [Fomitiporia mediterranea MF3/22]|uniref:uncharacterized protein n=1 Tax=Fomitiporia mediterranea (strain MF3/22) TaxID=694068 RepID=UPI0004409174|nr:uncharacterized protein FOMMEDRAFT_20700 [Fomitiporia mediterranea MF3/22]EJD01937.1 hypothetical protein FOMMEDRAFT_20700 [Fomitiporia mediterranea MF3/22]
MLIYFTSRVISSTAAFLYPGYASFKCLSQRPASEAELERWLMYWSVLGVIVGVEYVAEWLISWLPLYYPLKTIFLLYLSLPQTQGSSYLYVNYLQPFLHTHEADIDATLARVKARVYTYLQEKFRLLWSALLGSLGQSAAQPGAEAAAESFPPPTVADPVSGPTQLLGGLWRSYGPSIVASGASLFTMASAAAAAQQRFRPADPSPPRGQGQGRSVSQALAERRRQLEAELASLPPTDELQNSSGSESESPVKVMADRPGSSSYLPTSGTSEVDLRSRNGQYEEVEVPSDVEGYDVGPSQSAVPPSVNRQTSWFGWGGSPAVPDEKDD